MEKNEIYTKPVMEIIRLAADVITTSESIDGPGNNPDGFDSWD